MSRLFDAVVVVDWSAASRPVTGANSLWIGVKESGAAVETLNPATRADAESWLTDRLSDLLARGKRVLLGVDAALGYPRGTAIRLAPEAPTWRGLWKVIGGAIQDGPDNANNRFAAAAGLNARMAETLVESLSVPVSQEGGLGPFWGCPADRSAASLAPTRPDPAVYQVLPEYRLCDRRAAGPQPVWKLAYPGSVGSQTLTLLPVLWRLRHHPWLADAARLWPFETGLATPGPDARLVIAEVYPSLVASAPEGEEVLDQTQVRLLADRLYALDAAGALAPLFSGPGDLEPEDRHVIEAEEGWILGIEGGLEPPGGGGPAMTPDKAAVSAPYGDPEDLDADLRVPAMIYHESFARIRREADLGRLPPALQPLAIRLVHACGMADLVDDLVADSAVAEAAAQALAAGAPVLVDTRMVDHGIIRSFLPARNRVVCTLDDPATRGLATRLETTRSAAAVELWRPLLDGAVVAIGNAPTALYHLLRMLSREPDQPRPACILGFPVGFVGAAESKDALIRWAPRLGVSQVTLRGRRGGSALAAAAVNALARPQESAP